MAVIPNGMYGHQSVMLLPDDYPQFFDRAEGAYLWDVDGNRYVDFMCGYGPNLFGYGNAAIDQAYVDQMKQGDTMTGPGEVMVALAEAFTAQVSHADWAMFCKNGTDATTMAMMIARNFSHYAKPATPIAVATAEGTSDSLLAAAPLAMRPLAAAQLAGHYQLRHVGESRVAGRRAVVLLMLPRDRHRYGFELHLDRLTGLPLKSLLLGEQGQLLERLQFTQLDTLTPLGEQALSPSVACLPIVATAAAPVATRRWHAGWLPAGFSLLATHERRDPDSGMVLSWLLFADGLARFSVFIDPLQGEAPAAARTQLGPTVVLSRPMPTAAGEFMVTVVGEIPPGTAERVALAMGPAQESHHD